MLRKLLKSKQRKDKTLRMAKRWVKWWRDTAYCVWLWSLEVSLLFFTPSSSLPATERMRKKPSDDLSLSEQLGFVMHSVSEVVSLLMWALPLSPFEVGNATWHSWAYSPCLHLFHVSASTLGYEILIFAHNWGILAFCLTLGSSDGKYWKSWWVRYVVDRCAYGMRVKEELRWAAEVDLVDEVWCLPYLLKLTIACEEWIRLRMR